MSPNHSGRGYLGFPSLWNTADNHVTLTYMKLSVVMIAYNQEQFIAQAIESVLAQKVDFEYEIVVGEDCSTNVTPSCQILAAAIRAEVCHS
jgi:hypothetical protein